ncbi:asparagine synthetase B family protein [Actinokineospora soli]|uniref:asparagine synthase (glutamine-hydrolyzing) n=1 Tax=Actinokineospora soli TaxID=1048753 RepID=A0ABW2TYI7_9PSEU
MCGIAGYKRLDGAPADPAVLAEMAKALHHRGPDDSGTWAEGPVGFAHTRLSIIDLGASRQPMSASGVHLAFNGEILNYRSLRSSLDYPFKTSGDTETLLAGYLRDGVDGVRDLRGQFAYAVFDSRSQELHLVRDRLGILPLYYYVSDDVFAFASEIKALFPVIGTPRVDRASLHDYLAHRSVPAPHTLIEGVRKVPQGHRLTLGRDGQVRLRAYWELPVSGTRSVPAEEAVRLVASALDASIDDALVADVPVGAYLSGASTPA